MQQQTYFRHTNCSRRYDNPIAGASLPGRLPSGLTLVASSGNITGTPTVSGSFAFTAQVKDAAGQNGAKKLFLFRSPLPLRPFPRFGHVAIVVEENTKLQRRDQFLDAVSSWPDESIRIGHAVLRQPRTHPSATT